mgnify:CR=1 FL=1
MNREYRPLRGAWIETPCARFIFPISAYRPLRGAWIETAIFRRAADSAEYRPLRGAWIETIILFSSGLARAVSPPTGGVD